jgi:hypothetical protein
VLALSLDRELKVRWSTAPHGPRPGHGRAIAATATGMVIAGLTTLDRQLDADVLLLGLTPAGLPLSQ